MSDIVLTSQQGVFNLRACAIVRNGAGEILLQKKKHDSDTEWTLPGGKIAFTESSSVAVKRELKEEFDLEVTQLELVNVVEQTTRFNGQNYHQILFIYALVEPIEQLCCIDDTLNIRWCNSLDSDFVKPQWLRQLPDNKNVNHSIFMQPVD